MAGSRMYRLKRSSGQLLQGHRLCVHLQLRKALLACLPVHQRWQRALIFHGLGSRPMREAELAVVCALPVLARSLTVGTV